MMVMTMEVMTCIDGDAPLLKSVTVIMMEMMVIMLMMMMMMMMMIIMTLLMKVIRGV